MCNGFLICALVCTSHILCHTNKKPCLLCEQQAVSGRMAARISALESTHAEFKQHLSEVLHTSQTNQQALHQNTLVLTNLTSMVSIMMEKLGNQGTVFEPTTPTTQNTNSHMPSLDPMLNSGVGSEGDTLGKNGHKVVSTEDAIDVANETGEGVMGAGVSVEGGSKSHVSKGGVIEGHGSPGGGLIEGSSLGGGGIVAAPVGESTPSQAGLGLEGGIFCGKDAGSGCKVVASAGEGGAKSVSEEGGSGGLGSADGRKRTSENVSPGKRLAPRKARKKKKHNSPTRVGASASQEVPPSDQVSSDIERIGTHFPPKLVIFNVHGTLLDCSLLSEPNPNTSIRMTRRSRTRRIVFRPCLLEFIDKCFKNFRVAFWGIKSSANMDDVLAVIMRKFTNLDTHKPLFYWAAKECEEVVENIGVSKWKKPLSKVWGQWPEWNEGNTLIIDHMEALVECNPVANIIIPPAFYVENMTNLADDNNYLTKQLWPLLEQLLGSLDVHQFRSVLSDNKQGAGDHCGNVPAVGRTTRSSKMKVSNIHVSCNSKLAGEGICELLVHIVQCPLTTTHIKLANSCTLGLCAEGASKKDAEDKGKGTE